MRQQREQATKPLYEQAFQNAPAIDIEPIAKRIDSMLQIAKGEEARELASIRKMLTREKTGLDANGNQITITTLEDRPSALQRVKFDLDRRLNDPAVTAMDATIRSELAGVQNQLVNTMEAAIPEYKIANQEFARLSEPINVFMERRPGLALINMSRDNLDDFAKRVFGSTADPASSAEIRYTKQQITQSGPNGDVIWNEVS